MIDRFAAFLFGAAALISARASRRALEERETRRQPESIRFLALVSSMPSTTKAEEVAPVAWCHDDRASPHGVRTPGELWSQESVGSPHIERGPTHPELTTSCAPVSGPRVSPTLQSGWCSTGRLVVTSLRGDLRPLAQRDTSCAGVVRWPSTPHISSLWAVLPPGTGGHHMAPPTTDPRTSGTKSIASCVGLVGHR